MAIGATAVWQVRKTGSGAANANGGGYDAGIAGAGTDYTQQDSPQASWTNLTTLAANATTLTDTGATSLFTAAMVGNAINLASGTNAIAGYYFIVTFTDANNVILDRTPATAGALAAGNGKLGGAFVDPWTNFQSSNATGAKPVPGNIINIRGAGSDNPGSADYSTSGIHTLATGDLANGLIKIIGVNGRPRLQSNGGGVFYNGSGCWYENLYLAGGGTTNQGVGIFNGTGSGNVLNNVVIDQNGFDVVGVSGTVEMFSCEVFSSSAVSTHTQTAVALSSYGSGMWNCNIHDCAAAGVSMGASASGIHNSIIAKNGGDGISVNSISSFLGARITGNTIDGNTGNGITFADIGTTQYVQTFNNIISNHTAGGKVGMTVTGGTTAAVDRVKGFIDYNFYFGNTTDVSNISLGAHSVTGTDPQFAAQSTEGYQIGTNLKALGFPQIAFPQRKAGQTATQSYVDPGAAQRQEPASGQTIIINGRATVHSRR